MYWYKNNNVYYLADLDAQPVCLVILNHFGTAFVYRYSNFLIHWDASKFQKN